MKYGTDVTISCEITGITSQVAVEWFGSSGKIQPDANYTPHPGTYQSADNRQTATLEVKGAAVTGEVKFVVCKVQSIQFPSSGPSTVSANLNVYGESYHGLKGSRLIACVT